MTPAARKTAEAPAEPEAHAPVSARQMRQLHALLHGHGMTGDQARHDYLSAETERPITSARDLTTIEAAKIIATLETEDAPEVHTPSLRALRKLREHFPEEAIGKLPRSTCRACSESARKRCDQHSWVTSCPVCRGSHSSATMHIDYVGHADVTARLLEVDPSWTWTPMATDPNGFPILDSNGGLWINLTVCGVTRPGYGENSGGRQKGGEAVKVVIGDALRNAAMRFGVALDLWAKGDREWAKAEKWGADDMAPDQPPPPQQHPAATYSGPPRSIILARLTALAAQRGTDLDGITAKWRSDHDVDALETAPLPALYAHLQAVEAYVAQQSEATG